jgi:predicted outer membrane repeat protein
LTISNTLFDNNDAYGAGAIDNGGVINIFKSNFTNNKATKNGGAIDNNNVLNVIGSIFEGNVAGGQGGAIIARNDINVSYSSLYNNGASQGSAIYANGQNSNLSNNWWGINDPDFKEFVNFNISDEFKWIIMSVKSSSDLIQYENAELVISLNEVKDIKGDISKLVHVNLLPIFAVLSSVGNYITVDEGYASKIINVPTVSSIDFKLQNQVNSIKTLSNPSKIKDNKNVVADYGDKVTFKVQVYGIDGKPVTQNQIVVIKISGKSYEVKTDSRGYASKTFSLLPGKYKVTATYKASTVKNTITVKKVLLASSKTVKKAKNIRYKATLKKSNGKPIKGKKITFKINGKTYSAKTNKKGVATVTFKNLKGGKYSIAVKYLKSQVKTTLKVKR